jgi:hypothetical protein
MENIEVIIPNDLDVKLSYKQSVHSYRGIHLLAIMMGLGNYIGPDERKVAGTVEFDPVELPTSLFNIDVYKWISPAIQHSQKYKCELTMHNIKGKITLVGAFPIYVDKNITRICFDTIKDNSI